MTEDLQEIRERQEQLERYVNLLETRVDLQEGLMRLYAAGIEPAAPADAEDAGETRTSEDDPRLKGFDSLLRSILTQQGMHSTDLRKAVRGQERLQSRMENAATRLDSIVQMLHDVDRKVQSLVRRLDAR
jgi:SMC interacting uncharacterized protein involved in chromosome segregation